MSYSYTVTERPSYSRVAAAALLAVSAGACVGAALSFTPAAALYAPAAVRPAVATQMAAIGVPRTQMQAAYQYGSQQAAEEVATYNTQSSSFVSWTTLSGGVIAAVAAAVFLMKGKQSEQSEQIAMLAASGKKAAAPKSSGERLLWYPTAEPPAWLDGSLPGDRGFDPLGLSKPVEYLQFDLDSLDQNKGKNSMGKVVGKYAVEADQVSPDALAPYSEVFGLNRFRECELIHGRWAMLAALGVLIAEAATGVAWQDAGLVEASGATYFGFSLPFSGSQVVWFEVLSMGFVEIFRNTELNIERRCYPGGAFDPLGLAAKDDENTFRLKEAELKHGRLAMLAFLGFAAAAGNSGLGATGAFAAWTGGFA